MIHVLSAAAAAGTEQRQAGKSQLESFLAFLSAAETPPKYLAKEVPESQ